MKLEALLHASKVIAFPDSIAGAGALFMGRVDALVDPSGRWKNPLSRWATQFLPDDAFDLGVRFRPVAAVGNAGQVLAMRRRSGKEGPLLSMGYRMKGPDLTVGPASGLERFEMDEALSYAQAMLDAQDVDQDLAFSGALFIGSGSDDLPLDLVRRIYEAAQAVGSLGATVASGGAGGAMRIVNAGAYVVGAPSVGIPIRGAHQLTTEGKVFTDIQSITLNSAGYTSRIPLLQRGRRAVIAVPGGGGTMREIAATLLMFSAGEQLDTRIVFHDEAYYGALRGWTESLALPAQIRDAFYWTDSTAELQGLVEPWIRRRHSLVTSGRKIEPAMIDFLNPEE